LTGNGGKSKILVKILNKSINVEAEGNNEKEQFIGE